MNCPRCGKEIEEGSVFCRFCGVSLNFQPGQMPGANAYSGIASAPMPEPVPESAPAPVKTSKGSKVLMIIGMVLAAVGITGFVVTALVGLVIYEHAYFFDGYDYTKYLCILWIFLMLIGAILLFVGLMIGRSNAVRMRMKKVGIVFGWILFGLAICFSAILIGNGIKYGFTKKKSSGSSSSYSGKSSSSGYSSSSTMDHSTYCILYMKVSNVKTKRDGNWVYCTGTVKNTGTYNIRYVKVRAGFKDSRGNVIDTDWTYAVGSEWLYAGESKNFEIMIKDTDRKIQSADVIIIYD